MSKEIADVHVRKYQKRIKYMYVYSKLNSMACLAMWNGDSDFDKILKESSCQDLVTS